MKLSQQHRRDNSLEKKQFGASAPLLWAEHVFNFFDEQRAATSGKTHHCSSKTGEENRLSARSPVLLVGSGRWITITISGFYFGRSESSKRTLPVADGSINAMRQPPCPATGVSWISLTPFSLSSTSAPSISSTSRQRWYNP
jgi:hypothetical protein